MNFSPSKEVEEFIETVHKKVRADNKAVFGKAGLFFAIGHMYASEKNFRSKDSHGKIIEDITVTGPELRDTVRAALNHRTGKTLTESEYRHEFKRCFDWGCLQLKDLWEQTGSVFTFVSKLLELCEEDGSLISGTTADDRAATVREVVDTPVYLQIGPEIPNWQLNDVGGNGSLVISGGMGKGKTELALDLLAQASRQGLRFIFFDLKGEMEENPGNHLQQERRTSFLGLTGAQYVSLPHQSLPINPLAKRRQAATATAGYELADLMRAYAHQLGEKQAGNIAEAYEGTARPDFKTLSEAIKSRGSEGVDYRTIKRIADYEIFARATSAVPVKDWLRTSHVINLKDLGNDKTTKSVAVALILNLLMKEISENLPPKNGVQPLKMILFVDEAHLLLPGDKKFGLLSQIARTGRSRGFPLWLASQDADKFIVGGEHETNYANRADFGVHFSPEELTAAKKKLIFGKLPPREIEEKGEAVIRMQDQVIVGKVRQFWRDKGGSVASN